MDVEQTEGVKMLRVYAINGQILLERFITSAKTTIDVNQMENGAYLYEVLQDGTSIHQGKLIIQK
ncbi:T9SS type A sorting domain-containing protein [bacterium]|nr:T9SS type A sorting domain-containing protein [bacterium]